MATRTDTIRGQATLASWAAQRRKVRPRRFTPSADGLRFAFYGRMSTVDHQDRASSCLWQRNYAEDLVSGHGRIVVELFDEGVPRRVAWPDQPQASRLLAALTDPTRGFDAIVIGEYERAFHGRQLEQLTPTLVRHGVQLWLPETYGPVDFDNPRQLALLDLLGVHSQREVSRAGQGTAPPPPCAPKPSCRVGISVADRPTATSLWTLGRVATAHCCAAAP